MRPLFLLLITGCTSPCSSPTTPTPAAPPSPEIPVAALVPHAAPLASLAKVQEHKAQVEAGMQRVIVAMKAYPGSNPNAIAQAEAELQLFHDHFIAMRVEEVPEGLRVAEVAPCVKNPCFGYTVADVPGNMGIIAAYDSNSHAITFSASAQGSDPYAPYVMFHELSHAWDRLFNGLVQENGSLDTPVVPGTPNPTETQAYGFEAELLNGATHGRYFALADTTAQAILDRKIDYIGITPGPVTFFDIPDNLYGMVENDATMSEVGRQAMAMCFLITVNRTLIPTYPAITSGEENEGAHQMTLYNDIMNALPAPNVQEFIRTHM